MIPNWVKYYVIKGEEQIQPLWTKNTIIGFVAASVSVVLMAVLVFVFPIGAVAFWILCLGVLFGCLVQSGIFVLFIFLLYILHPFAPALILIFAFIIWVVLSTLTYTKIIGLKKYRKISS